MNTEHYTEHRGHSIAVAFTDQRRYIAVATIGTQLITSQGVTRAEALRVARLRIDRELKVPLVEI